MFGYIKPLVPLLTVAEYEAYKGVYCGLCREMGKVTGQLSRMTLSYDFAFLAFFRMLVDKIPATFDKGACIAHPFKKKTFAESNSALTFCAYATAILAAEKTKDDIADEKGSKRLCAKVLYPIEKRIVSKAPQEFSALAEKVSSYLEKLTELEKKHTASIDLPANVFGELLGKLCSFGYEGAKERIANEIGRSLGKIIYVLDAADDIEADIKEGKYNPIALLYPDPLCPKEANEEKKNGRAELILREEIREAITAALMLELNRARVSYSLLDTTGAETYSRIIENILDYGIPAEAHRVLNKTEKRENPLKHGA